MKKVIINSLSILAISIFSISCDYVNNVNPPVDPSTGPVSNVIYRKALVEDYTGHKCGNCPAAAITLSSLESSFSGKIVPMAVHAGFFAYTNATYTTNFQTTAGDAYDTQFGNSVAGNPNGLVNRVGYGTGGFIKAYTVWGSEVSTIVTQAAKFQIRIKNTFNTGTSKLTSEVIVKSLANNTGQYKLVLLLTENNIIAEQLDYSLPVGAQFITNYNFNHVLRGAINSEWGDAVFTTSANLNDSVVKTYTDFSVNSSYNPSKCHVIAYIYDSDSTSPTYYEVLQVEEEKVN